MVDVMLRATSTTAPPLILLTLVVTYFSLEDANGYALIPTWLWVLSMLIVYAAVVASCFWLASTTEGMR